MGGTLVRTIGFVRAKATTGMKSLAYNIAALASGAVSIRVRREHRATNEHIKLLGRKSERVG